MAYSNNPETRKRERQAAYERARFTRMEEMIAKTRAKYLNLIKEADELGLTHLLTREEYFKLHPHKGLNQGG